MAKLSVLLSDAEIERFDAYCREKGFKKSTLVARLIREHLEREAHYVQPELLLERKNQEKRQGEPNV